jgi:hypothetical protein
VAVRSGGTALDGLAGGAAPGGDGVPRDWELASLWLLLHRHTTAVTTITTSIRTTLCRTMSHTTDTHTRHMPQLPCILRCMPALTGMAGVRLIIEPSDTVIGVGESTAPCSVAARKSEV